MNKLDAKLASMQDEATIAAMHALRESIKAEVGELEIIISGKQQLEESITLLNKHKTNQFRTNMLMKWSRPGAGGADGGGGAAGGGVGGGFTPAGGGFTPRTQGKKQEELRTMQVRIGQLVSHGRIWLQPWDAHGCSPGMRVVAAPGCTWLQPWDVHGCRARRRRSCPSSRTATTS